MARCDAGPDADPEGGPEPEDSSGKKAERPSLRYNTHRRKAFVQALAESYDVEAALHEAKLTWPEVCTLRFRYPEFAAQIDEVIVAGFDRLEAAFLRVATAALATAKPDVALVQAVLKLRRPARAAAAPAKVSARDAADQKRQVDRIMGKIAQLGAAQSGGGGDANSERSAAQVAGDG